MHVDLIKTVVLDQIKALVKAVCDQKSFAKELLEGTRSKGKLLSGEKKLVSLKRKLSDNENAVATLYTNLTEGVIDEEDYKALSQHYMLEKENLHAEMKAQKDLIVRQKKTVERYCELADDFERYMDDIAFDKNLLDAFVDRITVWNNGTIDIRFKCEDVISRFTELLEES
jgi:hypothetical protein